MKYLIVLFCFMLSFLSYSGTKAKFKKAKKLGYAEVVLTKSNSLILNGAVDFKSTTKVLTDFMKKNYVKRRTPFYLVLDTPGGGIQAGLEMIDFLSNYSNVHTLTIFAASMGFITAQHLGYRYITQHGVLMTHKASGSFRGEFPGQLDSRYNFWKERINTINRAVVKRTRGKHTLKSYEALYENEYWCEGQECIDQGFADSIVYARCGKSLQGMIKRTDTFSFFGMKVKITYKKSECPLITGVIVDKASVNGKSYTFTDRHINAAIKKVINPKGQYEIKH